MPAANRVITGLFDSDRLADAVGICDKQLRDAWHVQDLTEREKVAGYEVIGRVQEEGRRPPVPENQFSVEKTHTHILKFAANLDLKRTPSTEKATQQSPQDLFSPRDDGAIFSELQ